MLRWHLKLDVKMYFAFRLKQILALYVKLSCNIRFNYFVQCDLKISATFILKTPLLSSFLGWSNLNVTSSFTIPFLSCLSILIWQCPSRFFLNNPSHFDVQFPLNTSTACCRMSPRRAVTCPASVLSHAPLS